jgi:hypothetical protein
MTHTIIFENGQSVESYYTDYITLITWEQMYCSRIATIDGNPINN